MHLSGAPACSWRWMVSAERSSGSGAGTRKSCVAPPPAVSGTAFAPWRSAAASAAGRARAAIMAPVSDDSREGAGAGHYALPDNGARTPLSLGPSYVETQPAAASAVNASECLPRSWRSRSSLDQIH